MLFMLFFAYIAVYTRINQPTIIIMLSPKKYKKKFVILQSIGFI